MSVLVRDRCFLLIFIISQSLEYNIYPHEFVKIKISKYIYINKSIYKNINTNISKKQKIDLHHFQKKRSISQKWKVEKYSRSGVKMFAFPMPKTN